jgi:hypothetical protein|tara:strand:- start:25 stop:270 length:246 start_codon:yes stop_codon:yes gene_type:complete
VIPATTSVSTDALSSKLDEDTIYFFVMSKNVIPILFPDRRGLFGLPRRLFARVHNLTRSRENLRQRFLLSQILVNAFGEEL